MKKRVVWLVLLACACSKPERHPSSNVDKLQEEASINLPVLSEEQKQQGWELLFNGKNFEGWRFYKEADNNSWEVKDGILHCKSFESAKKRADLITLKNYQNFELNFEWKISYQGNSGIMFHVSEEYDQPYYTGPEYQILDDENYPGDVLPVHFSGGCYGMYAPENKHLNNVGEWNSSKLIVRQSHVEHWLNNSKVLQYEIGSDDWQKTIQASKWKDVPSYGSLSTGFIDIQDHNHEVWFRNIMIKEL